jgi:signal transduction histidine kinase
MSSYLKIVLASLILLCCSSVNSQEWNPPVKGVLDLRNIEFGEGTYIKLIGEWEFYWEEFVPPHRFHSVDPPLPTLYGPVPGYWEDYIHETETFPGTGYATYRLQILLPGNLTRDIGFDVPLFDDAVSIYLDGKKIMSSGKPGRSELTSEPDYTTATLIYRPVSDTLEIVLHVSNFRHRRGSFWKSMQIGDPGLIIKTKQKYRLIVFISLGVLAAFSLFFLFFYIFYRKDKIPLTFSIILAGVFIRMMNTDLLPVKYIMNISWEWIIRFEYLGTFMAFGAALWYFYRLFPARHMLWITRINTLLIFICGVIILFFRVRVFAYTMFYFQPAIILMLLYYFIACIISIYRGNRENIYFLAGLVLFITAIANDILVANSVTTVSRSYTSHFALLIFVFIQAVLIIRSWISAFKEKGKLMQEIEYINKNLETLVDERTIELNRRNREIHRKNEDIEERNKELNEALEFKNKVFSIIAHDLKSPIASLVQNSLLLDYNPTKEKSVRLIESFRESSRSALNLIDNLLFWGRSQGALLSYHPELINIKPILDNMLKLFGDIARPKSISLDLNLHGSTQVFADQELFEIVCRNLLSNAIKFTKQGGEVHIETFEETEAGKMIIRFEDNGIGIPADRLDDLLNSRELISTAGTEREKGTGLGLKLCMELVAVNKGELKIESEEGKGTVVEVRLPVTGG